MRRVFVFTSVAALLFLAVLLQTPVKDFLWAHPWWHSNIVALPAIVLALVANALRMDANRQRAEASALEIRIEKLTAELSAERNKHPEPIAANTEKPVTRAFGAHAG
jgi:hypothetical protein